MHPSHAMLLSLRKQENQTLVHILKHLQIVNDQKVFVQMGYSSLLKYCVKELQYSESAAYRRISTIRLEKKTPDIMAKIKKGEVSLSAAAKLNSLLRQKLQETNVIKKNSNLNNEFCQEKVKPVDLSKLLDQISHKSSIEAELIMRDELALPKKKRLIQVEVEEDSYQKWLEYRGRHVAQFKTDESLLMQALDESLAYQRRERREATPTRKAERRKEEAKAKKVKKTKKIRRDKLSSRRYITAKVRREVLKEANYKCQYPECNSTFGLEIDHIYPFSKGGSNDRRNLQVLCRHHNGLKSDQVIL